MEVFTFYLGTNTLHHITTRGNRSKLYQDFVQSAISLKSDEIIVTCALAANADKLDLKQYY